MKREIENPQLRKRRHKGQAVLLRGARDAGRLRKMSHLSRAEYMALMVGLPVDTVELILSDTPPNKEKRNEMGN